MCLESRAGVARPLQVVPFPVFPFSRNVQSPVPSQRNGLQHFRRVPACEDDKLPPLVRGRIFPRTDSA